MKRRLMMQRWIVMGILAAAGTASAQTTTSQGKPTISGFAPNAVSGYSARPVTGFTPAPVQGLAPTPTVPASTNFTTGPITTLSTSIAGGEQNSEVAVPVVPVVPVPPITNRVTNPVPTPLF